MSYQLTDTVIRECRLPEAITRGRSTAKLVLVVLANHAEDEDGNNAFPSIHTLVRETELRERTVIYALKALRTN